MATLDVLPTEDLWKILVEVDPRDIEGVCASHKNALAICSEEDFWQDKYKHDFGAKRALPWADWKKNYKYAYFHSYYPLPPELIAYLNAYSDRAFEKVKAAEEAGASPEDLEELRVRPYVKLGDWEEAYLDILVEDEDADREIDPTVRRFSDDFEPYPVPEINFIYLIPSPRFITKEEARAIFLSRYRSQHDYEAYANSHAYIKSLYSQTTTEKKGPKGAPYKVKKFPVYYMLRDTITRYIKENEKIPPGLTELDVYNPRQVEQYLASFPGSLGPLPPEEEEDYY